MSINAGSIKTVIFLSFDLICSHGYVVEYKKGDARLENTV
jgi:hypothetical protein